RMLHLLLASATLAAAASAACTQAQMDIIVKCYTDYNVAYGVKDQFPPFNQDYFEGFHRARSNMMNKDGIVAKPAIQIYGAALTECLKPVAACIDDSTYEQPPLLANPNAVDGPDGHRFNLDRLQTAYTCTEPGYSYQMRHFYCIDHFKADTTSAPFVQMKKCNADMNTALAGNPSDELKCSEYNKDMECYRDVFATYCRAEEAGEFYCQLVSQEYRIWAPNCNFIDCKKH
ncbi:hypothetical protein PFISCL1PPCAC_5542, partial [Pristionchus fissidentatus]